MKKRKKKGRKLLSLPWRWQFHQRSIVPSMRDRIVDKDQLVHEARELEKELKGHGGL